MTVATSNWQVVTERAVAVIGNLSTSSEYFGALREAGSLQRLVWPLRDYKTPVLPPAVWATPWCHVWEVADDSCLLWL